MVAKRNTALATGCGPATGCRRCAAACRPPQLLLLCCRSTSSQAAMSLIPLAVIAYSVTAACVAGGVTAGPQAVATAPAIDSR